MGRRESSCLGSTHLPSCHPLSHLHEGTEERVVVLLLPGVSHGLLHFQAVLDIGLEPLADLEGHGEGSEQAGKEGHEIQALAAEHGDQGVPVRVGVVKASHRSVVQLLPIPTSHDCQPFSLDSKEEVRTREADLLLLSELLSTAPACPTALNSLLPSIIHLERFQDMQIPFHPVGVVVI